MVVGYLGSIMMVRYPSMDMAGWEKGILDGTSLLPVAAELDRLELEELG